MDARTHTLQNVFYPPVRHEVPLYQRPYVWSRERHWEPLTEDVFRLAEAKLAGEEQPAPHFMGAIVLEQQASPTGSVETRQVIDGQQRLTTLQLLLKATRDVAAMLGNAQAQQMIEKLVYNETFLTGDVADHRFKLWPTYADRDAFRAVMAPDGVPADHQNDPNNTIDDAYEFFVDAVGEWVEKHGPDEVASRLDALASVMWHGLSLVVIDLGHEDDAQIIFETLNARGTPLLAFDLVKNLVFRRAEAQGLSLPDLHDSHWSELESSYWRANLGRGHRQRPRSEQFLLHWLTAETGRDVAPARLFKLFSDVFEERGAADVRPFVEEFRRDAMVWRSFESQEVGSTRRRFFRRLNDMGVLTAHPLILLLMRADSDVVAATTVDRTLAIVESWLVRRMLLKLSTRGYGTTFADLVGLVKPDPGRADATILERLATGHGESTVWPADQEIIDACVQRPMYNRQLNVTRTKMVLSGIELGLRSALSESLELPANLQIEHIMPQTWHATWPVESAAQEVDRDRRLHVLGNLTLVTGRLNPSLSNAPWAQKRQALNDHSVLMLNRKVVDENPEAWGEQAIDLRSESLAKVICTVWPGPTAWS